MSSTDFNRLQKITARFGSPLYHYDLDRIDHQVQRLKQALPESAGIYYSLKANPLPSIVKRVVESGCHLEITSENELSVALQSGLHPVNLLYGGPGKTTQEIAQALSSGVRRFSVESWADLHRLNAAAISQSLTVEALLRISPSQAVASGLAMSGASTQFGFSENELLTGQSELKDCSLGIRIVGFHVYYGTQMSSVEMISESVELAVAAIERICEAWQFHPETIDLGGGFPWPYGKTGEGESIAHLRDSLDQILAKRQFSSGATVWFETGRFVAAPSGTLLTGVLDVKRTPDNSAFVVLDAGINHLGGMAGLGRIPRAGFQFQRISTGDSVDGPHQKVTLVGPLCSPLDCLARQVQLPLDTRPGDILAVPNVGAYGLTASLVGFLSRPTPLEVASDSNGIVAIHQWAYGHIQHENSAINEKLRETEI